jgi:hypothetical protein
MRATPAWGKRRFGAWVGVVVLVVSLLVAGCSGTASPSIAALQPGRTWQLVEVRTGSKTLSPIPSTRASTIKFNDGHMTGSDSVNPYQADYSESGDHVTVSGSAIGAAGVAQESTDEGEVRTAMVELFSGSSGPVGVSLEGNRLVLTTGPYVLVFT